MKGAVPSIARVRLRSGYQRVRGGRLGVKAGVDGEWGERGSGESEEKFLKTWNFSFK